MGAAFPIVGGLFGAFSSMEAAKRQNELAQQSMRSSMDAFNLREFTQKKKRDALFSQTMERRDMEALKQSRFAAQARGRVKAAQAAGGLSTGSGIGARQIHQVNQQASFGQEMLSRNEAQMLEQVQSDYSARRIENVASFQAQINQAMQQQTNETFAMISGGLSGIGSGMAIAGGGKDMGWWGGG